jgi:hypothetical protein
MKINTKLILAIEQELISKAKKYPKNKGRSLSDLVENYFKVITKTSEIENDSFEISPKVNSLMGSVKLPEGFDYKKVLSEEINKKHA